MVEVSFSLMTSELFVSIVYYVLLYGTLGMTAIPVVFLVLWSFLDYWKRRPAVFYALMVLLYVGIVAGFYFSRNFWIYWYSALPGWVQIFGLLLVVVTGFIVKVAELDISIPVRFFYPVLKGKPIQLSTKGLYGIVRHPMYAVFPWFVLGVFCYTSQFVLLPVFVLNLVAREWYARREEAYLKTVLGDAYKSYMRRVPNRFYPQLF